MSTIVEQNAVHTPRYEDRGRFGIGACADVRRVYDRRMKREVALKIVTGTAAPTPGRSVASEINRFGWQPLPQQHSPRV